MANKILGYVLLITGLAIIFWTLWQSYAIFTGAVSAPLVFKTPAADQSVKNGAKTAEQQIQAQMDQAIQKQLNQIIQPDSITKILNLMSWSVLAGILIFGGGSLSSIGIKLLK